MTSILQSWEMQQILVIDPVYYIYIEYQYPFLCYYRPALQLPQPIATLLPYILR